MVIEFISVALHSLKDIGRLTYRRFLELFRHMEDSLDEQLARRKASTYTGQHNIKRRDRKLSNQDVIIPMV
jgi:hypothetical protein